MRACTTMTFIAHATQGFEAYAAHVESYTLDCAADATGVPAEAIREMAHAYATADTAQILWTLGITEHHNAVDNVVSLCNLALLTGHVGRWGSGLVPLRGQNNVQGGGDMGAIPNKFPGFQDVADDAVRAKFETAYGTELNGVPGKHLTLMFEAMEAGELRACYVIGENPADSEADVEHARKLLAGLDTLVVQDIFMTRTAEMADVVLPASVAWAESDGTVTSSERRVQRVRAAVPPAGPGPPRHRHHRGFGPTPRRRLGPPQLRGALGRGAVVVADACRHVLGAPRGLRRHPVAVPERGPSRLAVPAWLAVGRRPRGPRPRAVQHHRPRSPQGAAHRRLPAAAHHGPGPRLLQHRGAVGRLCLAHPLRRRHRRQPGRRGRARRGRRGAGAGQLATGLGGDGCAACSRMSPTGLTFTTFHFPELVDTNVLTNDEWDPRSGTSEFKAAAIRISKLEPEPATA